MIRAGHPRAQAAAAAYREAGERHRKAIGGTVPQPPWYIRREASEIYHPQGFLHSTGAGRADTLPRVVAAESHVVPADVVAGLGDGNSLAGAKVMNHILSTGPFGTALPHGGGRGHFPSAPRPGGFASGGQVQKVPVQLSGGEYVISPDQVAKWGNGDVKKGHAAIDKFILSVRGHTAKHLKRLPKPKR